MTPFFAGMIFGGLVAAGLFMIFVSRARRADHDDDDWDEPFIEPAPIPHSINRQLIRERTFK